MQYLATKKTINIHRIWETAMEREIHWILRKVAWNRDYMSTLKSWRISSCCSRLGRWLFFQATTMPSPIISNFPIFDPKELHAQIKKTHKLNSLNPPLKICSKGKCRKAHPQQVPQPSAWSPLCIWEAIRYHPGKNGVTIWRLADLWKHLMLGGFP